MIYLVNFNSKLNIKKKEGLNLKNKIFTILKLLGYSIGGIIFIALFILGISIISYIFSLLAKIHIVTLLYSIIGTVILFGIGVAMFYSFVEWIKNKLQKR